MFGKRAVHGHVGASDPCCLSEVVTQGLPSCPLASWNELAHSSSPKAATMHITKADLSALIAAMGDQASSDLQWAESLSPPACAEDFALEAIFVICNSGMKNTVARGIFERCRSALLAGAPVASVFRHPGKSSAIEFIWRDRKRLLDEYLVSDDKLGFCRSLPWIGDITKYHLAKNLGFDVAKPDVHLQRLADREGCSVQSLCERLAAETGMRVATVDTLLWRACADGYIDSRTGVMAHHVGSHQQ